MGAIHDLFPLEAQSVAGQQVHLPGGVEWPQGRYAWPAPHGQERRQWPGGQGSAGSGPGARERRLAPGGPGSSTSSHPVLVNAM